MAFVMAKYWGVMPAVIWRYPFRYFKELRDHMLAATGPRPPADEPDSTFDWEEESVVGPSV